MAVVTDACSGLSTHRTGAYLMAPALSCPVNTNANGAEVSIISPSSNLLIDIILVNLEFIPRIMQTNTSYLMLREENCL